MNTYRPHSVSLLCALIFICLAGPRTAAAVELEVTGTIVNLRAGPALEQAVLLKLPRGRRLIELSRQGDWIEVGTGRDDVKSGWIHHTLLKPLPDTETGAAPVPAMTPEPLRDIDGRFRSLNEDLTREYGFAAFTGDVVADSNTLEITATPDWFIASQAQREQILSAVFELWSDSLAPGASITVQVLDAQGNRHMMMFR